jgi:transcriptional regulator with XRE-family HTH domain
MYLNLKVAIWQTGLRQNRLAQTLNMDEALLSRIINGFREPTSEQRSRIAQVLQKDEQWLFAREPSVAPPVEAMATAESKATPEPNPA